jgi:hypothetical protein
LLLLLLVLLLVLHDKPRRSFDLEKKIKVKIPNREGQLVQFGFLFTPKLLAFPSQTG